VVQGSEDLDCLATQLPGIKYEDRLELETAAGEKRVRVEREIAGRAPSSRREKEVWLIEDCLMEELVRECSKSRSRMCLQRGCSPRGRSLSAESQNMPYFSDNFMRPQAAHVGYHLTVFKELVISTILGQHLKQLSLGRAPVSLS
jgi:hypothetical protein